MWQAQLIIILSLLVHHCFGLLCQHYSNTSIGEEDNPCKPSDVGSDGICNIMRECKPHAGQTQSNCFSSWRNDSGVITVMKKGCWGESNDCFGKSTCITNTWRAVLYCCCETKLCNVDFEYEPTDDPKENHDGTIDGNPEIEPEEKDQVLMVLATTLTPIAACCLIIAGIVGFYFWRKKQTRNDLDMMSVETPGSGVTTSTLVTSLLSPGQPESKIPQLLELKARGRFGCVWKAQLHDRYVAVKIFYMQDKQSWQNEQDIFSNRLLSEHPHILRCITATMRGVGVETELWLITEFHEHGSLTDFLKVHTLSLTEALKIIQTMASGLSFLHADVSSSSMQGCVKPAIAHRDFKSKNVLVTDQKSAVIADFGLAVKFEPGEAPGDSHGQVGTRRYMAPEILEGAINFQRDSFLRIDMYAFALVVWEVITRCVEVPGGAAPLYLMPYELELGQHPSLEEMQECVVDRKVRPKIRREWRQHGVVGIICETIDECWDHDVDARLSAGCVEERINNLQNKVIAPPTELPLHSNRLSPDVITNITPLHPISVDTEVQNQINSQKNSAVFMKPSTNEESSLLSTESTCLPETHMSTRSSSMLIPPHEPGQSV